MMWPPSELYNKLRSHIDDTRRKREEECKRYLEYVPHLLIRDSFGKINDIIRVKTEYRHHTGDSDYIISAYVSANGRRCARAYVWEIKAPQCFVFEKKTENRACPSRDLIQAENQLLHYYDDLKHDVSSYTEFGVSIPEDVCFGGIIIGCNRTKVRNEGDKSEMDNLYNRAIRCRNYFYEHAKGTIRLMLWDEIADALYEKHIFKEHKSVEAVSPFETPKITPDTINVFGDEKPSPPIE